MKSKLEFIKEIQKLRLSGHFLIKDFASPHECNNISETLKFKSHYFTNCNEFHPTIIGLTTFNKHAIAISKTAFRIVTSSWILDIAESFIGAKPILKCSRSYSISKFDPLFEWHTDNKDSNNLIDKSKGIVFILFLEDDLDGTFSLVEGIKNLPDSRSSLPSNEQLENWNKNKLIRKFPVRKGDLLGFSQDIFHRHVTKRKKSLNAFWFQIIGEDAGVGERIIFNPSFLEENNKDRILKYLSSKNKRINLSFPVSNINSLTLGDNIKYLIILFSKIPKSFLTSLRLFLLRMLPYSIICKFRKN